MPYVWVLSGPLGPYTFGKNSGKVSVFKRKSGVHFRNKTGLLLQLTLQVAIIKQELRSS